MQGYNKEAGTLLKTERELHNRCKIQSITRYNMNQNKLLSGFSVRKFQFLWLLPAAIIFLGCDRKISLSERGLFVSRTPREAYLAALSANDLQNTQMVKDWILAGEAALQDSTLAEAPFQETGYFRADRPDALAYRMKLTTGELLQISLTTEPDSTLFFVDFYEVETVDSTENLRRLFSARDYQTDSLTYESEEGGTYLLRIQPELLTSCRFTLQLIVQPVYGVFPVSGKGNPDVWSFYGDPRDGGKREHHGIDIFARRGTPVVAAVDGIVRSVRDRGLGGKQVWLNDPKRRQSLYYAHLDSQLVSEGRRVLAGDTLGLVGNTGNARNTRPHLHFGIYRRGRGPLDPFPYVASRDQKAPAVRADTSRLGQLARVRQNNTSLRVTPAGKSAVLASLPRYLPLEVISASNSWYRVRSPHGLSGYLPSSSLEDTDRAISILTLSEPSELLASPVSGAGPVTGLEAESTVAVIGINGAYQLVRNAEGETGWLAAAE